MADLPDVAHIARIARLALSAEEAQRFAKEAQTILNHFEAVMAAGAGAETADPPGVEPRPDDAVAPDPAQVQAIAGQFPRKEGPYAKAPGGL